MSQLNALVVEDSPTMRQLIVFALSRIKNLKVTEADDGVDGLKKLSSQKFDILITDINMPIMDGLKLVSKVRNDETHKLIPIVINTTEGAQEDRQRAWRERVHHQADSGAASDLQSQRAAEDYVAPRAPPPTSHTSAVARVHARFSCSGQTPIRFSSPAL